MVVLFVILCVCVYQVISNMSEIRTSKLLELLADTSGSAHDSNNRSNSTENDFNLEESYELIADCSKCGAVGKFKHRNGKFKSHYSIINNAKVFCGEFNMNPRRAKSRSGPSQEGVGRQEGGARGSAGAKTDSVFPNTVSGSCRKGAALPDESSSKTSSSSSSGSGKSSGKSVQKRQRLSTPSAATVDPSRNRAAACILPSPSSSSPPLLPASPPPQPRQQRIIMDLCDSTDDENDDNSNDLSSRTAGNDKINMAMLPCRPRLQLVPCVYCEKFGCQAKAVFNFGGATTSGFCDSHMKKGMVRICPDSNNIKEEKEAAQDSTAAVTGVDCGGDHDEGTTIAAPRSEVERGKIKLEIHNTANIEDSTDNNDRKSTKHDQNDVSFVPLLNASGAVPTGDAETSISLLSKKKTNKKEKLLSRKNDNDNVQEKAIVDGGDGDNFDDSQHYGGDIGDGGDCGDGDGDVDDGGDGAFESYTGGEEEEEQQQAGVAEDEDEELLPSTSPPPISPATKPAIHETSSTTTTSTTETTATAVVTEETSSCPPPSEGVLGKRVRTAVSRFTVSPSSSSPRASSSRGGRGRGRRGGGGRGGGVSGRQSDSVTKLDTLSPSGSIPASNGQKQVKAPPPSPHAMQTDPLEGTQDPCEEIGLLSQVPHAYSPSTWLKSELKNTLWGKAYKRVYALVQALQNSIYLLDVVYMGGSDANAITMTSEINKARSDIQKKKQLIKDVIQEICKENCEHTRLPALEDEDEDGMIDVAEVHCSKCQSACDEHNDILLCDMRGCNRAYHSSCLDPPILEKHIISDNPDDDWFCWECRVLADILMLINDRLETHYESLQDIFCDAEGQDKDSTSEHVLWDDEESDDDGLFKPSSKKKSKKRKRSIDSDDIISEEEEGSDLILESGEESCFSEDDQDNDDDDSGDEKGNTRATRKHRRSSNGHSVSGDEGVVSSPLTSSGERSTLVQSTSSLKSATSNAKGTCGGGEEGSGEEEDGWSADEDLDSDISDDEVRMYIPVYIIIIHFDHPCLLIDVCYVVVMCVVLLS
jgi:hypothetical protein